MTTLHGIVLALGASFILLACGPADTLTEAEMAKLEPVLQQLFMNETPPDNRYQTQRADNGTLLYEVILMVTDTKVLTDAGIGYDVHVAGMATARLSVADIKRAARIEGVTAIRNSEVSYPNGSGDLIIEEH